MDIPNPPNTINGEVSVTTIPRIGENIKQIKHEKNRPKAASTAIPKLSVVRPFTELISSVRVFVKIPGARFLLSNHPMCLLKYA